MGVSCYRNAEKNFEMGLQSASTKVTTFYDNLSKTTEIAESEMQRRRGAYSFVLLGKFFRIGNGNWFKLLKGFKLS